MKTKLSILIVLALALWSCEQKQESFTLSTTVLQMKVGDIMTIEVKGGAPNAQWKTSNEDVASVCYGVVTANAIGKAIIELTSGNTTRSCEVYVNGTDGASLRITPAIVNLKKGETFQFSYGNTYEFPMTWTSSDETVALVTQSGLVTALEGGNSTISLSTGAETVTAIVAVEHEWDEYKLVWSDEFNGTSLDLDNWNIEVNGNGGGNNEAQYYTDRAENVRVENGCLVLQARKEEYKGKSYTSGRINTRNKKKFAYGKIEASISLPSGGGTWPAFWMLGATGMWPNCGEIDIMEYVGNVPNRVLFTLHSTKDRDGARSNKAAYINNIENTFHTYGIEWVEQESNGRDVIRFYVDGVVYNTQIENTIDDHDSWPFNREFYIILNLAIGGTLGGHINDAIFNNDVLMKVDWVRVYQRELL